MAEKNFKGTTVPYWKKKVGTKIFKRFISIIKESSPMTEEEWKKPNIAKSIRKYGQFVHLETDITDSSEGIMPKQIKKILHLDDEEIIDLFSILNQYANKTPLINYIDEDGFISWSNLFNNFYNNLGEDITYERLKQEIFYLIEGEILNRFVIGENFTFSIENIEALKLMHKEKLLNEKFYRGSSLEDKDINIEDILKERRILWKKIAKVSPQSKWILLANPENFTKIFIQKIQSVFEEKQLAKLDENIQKYIGKLLNSLGENIILLSNEEIINSEQNMPITSSNQKIDSNIQLLKKIGKTDPLHMKNLIHYSLFLTENKEIEKELSRKDIFTKNDLDVFSYISERTKDVNITQKKMLLSLPFKYWTIFFRYGVNVTTDILKLVELFEKNKDNTMNIPIVKGEIEKYSYEILEKNNPMGLILGYATDCCQVMTANNAGTQCLIEGYTNPNSTFFVVKKGKDIIAQSWIWTRDKSKLCFDSIEVLGKNLEKNYLVLECYLEASKKLKEKGYDIVFAGADGNVCPNGLKESGLYLSPIPNELSIPFSCYSDSQREIVIFEGKEKYKDYNEA